MMHIATAVRFATIPPSGSRRAAGFMTPLLVFCLFCSGSLTRTSAAIGTNDGTRHALLIGISRYPAPFEALQYSGKDVQALQDSLVSSGFPEAHVICMHDDTSRADYLPTRSNILRQLELRLKLASPNDLVIVAFAGHGLVANDVSYICPVDAQWNDIGDSCISVADVYRLMAECPARQKVLILDTRRTDRVFRGFHISATTEGFGSELPEPARGLRVLHARQEGQLSLEDPQLGHGLFMHYVTEGLKGTADTEVEGNGNGRVSLDELYAFAYERTRARAATWFGAQQQPSMRGEHVGLYNLGGPARDSTGQLAAALPARSKTAGSVPPTRTVKTTTPIAAMSREADACLVDGDYDGAIRTYSAILAQSQLPQQMRDEAYRNRGAAYMSRGKPGDLAHAIEDQKKAGLPGTCASIRSTSAELKYGKETRATLREGQVVMLTAAQDDWLWVSSVDGDSQFTGWIQTSDVVADQASRKETKKTGNKLTLVQPTSMLSSQPAMSSNQPTQIMQAVQWHNMQGYQSIQYQGGGSFRGRKRGGCYGR